MREININIEGYNVNGICVGCLNYNRRMFYNDDVKECFRILANIDVPDGLTVQACWECLARARAALRFRKQVIHSYDCLIKYSKMHTFLDSPSDLSSNAHNCLSVCVHEIVDVVSTVDVKDEDGDDPEIKVEVDDKIELDIDGTPFDINEDLTPNKVTLEEKPDPDEKIFEDDHYHMASQINNLVSSDDDVLLSKLKNTKKKEKKKRGRKKKEKSEKEIEEKPKRERKRLSLPEDLVEVVRLSEEGMRLGRRGDQASEEFARATQRCASCLLHFQTRRQLLAHRAGKHSPDGKKTFQCDVCNSYFVSSETMSTHREHHLTGYRCRKCEYSTTMKHLMKIHLQKKHGVGEVNVCKECGREFSTKSKLNYHKAQCVLSERPQCDCCGKVFANKVTLQHHLKPSSETKAKALYIPCKGCDKVFFSKKSYRAHVVIHDGLTYPCPTCGKLFRWKRNLSRHARNHRDRAAGTPHHCAACGKSFASRDCLANHLKMSKRHVAESAYMHACHFCGKKFATKWCMVDHMDWDHLKRIKYQCSICFKAFKTAKIMVAHVNNIHEGKNKANGEGEPDGGHLCDICGKSYKTVKRLKGHVWAMHTKRTQNKSYACSLCPATFSWQTSIYKHMKMMHHAKQKPQPPKKTEPYPEIELSNRMQYFQQNIANNIQNIVPPSIPSIHPSAL